MNPLYKEDILEQLLHVNGTLAAVTKARECLNDISLTLLRAAGEIEKLRGRKNRKYCYHITNGVTRSALQCGTVTASSMEEAAETAAKRAKLEKLVETDVHGLTTVRWTKNGERRSVYVLHDPEIFP